MTLKLYKAAEVCEMTGLQPYVLRSWEKEFPGIGVQKPQDGSRLYRQSDVDQVVRIKQLVFSEGLTLSGARRRLEESSPPPSAARDEEMAEVLDALGADARARIAAVRNGLRSLLEVLSKRPGSAGMAELRQIGGRANGGPRAQSTTDRRRSAKARPAVARGKASVAAKRTVASKRAAAARKSRRGTKRKRAGA